MLADLGGLGRRLARDSPLHWLGYSDEKLAALCARAVAEGFTQVKIKVGAALDDDMRRCALP